MDTHHRQIHKQHRSVKMDISLHKLCSVLVLILSTVTTTTAQCPNTDECECHSPDPILYCKNKNLNQVPAFQETTMQFTEVTLADNRISDLPANAFQTTGGEGLHTTMLDLSDNQITSIDDNAFSGLEDNLEILKLDVSSMNTFPKAALAILTNLKELYLKGFSISSLPQDALSPFTSLQILSMQSCGLNSLSNSDLSSQRTTLEEIHLKFNQFTSVPKESLSSLSELEVLDLGGNSITEIASNDFSGMQSLGWLDLSQNGVSTISTNAFSGLEDTLRVLSLSTNGDSLVHSDLNPLKPLRSLQELDLSLNSISEIPSGLFQSMNQLQILDLKTNKISSISSNDFIGLDESLKNLNLAENGLRTIQQLTFQALSGLEDLSLEHNELQGTFNQNTFVGLTNLKTLKLMKVGFRDADFSSISPIHSLENLNLEDNEIVSLPDYSFENLNSLKSLDLAENAIVTLTQQSLHGLQPSLITILLDFNKIQTLPSCLLYGFTNHVTLGLSNNPLHCECEAYWLKLRIDNMNDFERLLNDWKCTTPDEHGDEYLKTIPNDELCDPPPAAEQCMELNTTPSTTTTTTGPSTSRAPSSPMVVETEDVKSDSMKVVWTVVSNEELITKFTLECQEAQTGEIKENRELGRHARDAMLEDLDASTQYIVCVTSWIGDNYERTCTDATTMPASSSRKSKLSSIQIILGCVLAVVVLLVVVGAVICLVCVWRRRKTRYPPPIKSTTSLNSQVPIVTDHSKRFSKPKPYSISTDNIVNSIEMERRLEGFTPDERDRILQLFSKSGASTLSMMSVGSTRYVPDPTGGAVGGAYLNQIPIQDDGQYEELPGDQYNYIAFDEINPDIIDEQPHVYPPPLRPETYI